MPRFPFDPFCLPPQKRSNFICNKATGTKRPPVTKSVWLWPDCWFGWSFEPDKSLENLILCGVSLRLFLNTDNLYVLYVSTVRSKVFVWAFGGRPSDWISPVFALKTIVNQFYYVYAINFG